MKYKGYELHGIFEYVCESETGEVNPFTIFANVTEERDGIIILERFQKFGKQPVSKTEMTKKMFEKYYAKLIPDEQLSQSEYTKRIMSDEEAIVKAKEELRTAIYKSETLNCNGSEGLRKINENKAMWLSRIIVLAEKALQEGDNNEQRLDSR